MSWSWEETGDPWENPQDWNGDLHFHHTLRNVHNQHQQASLPPTDIFFSHFTYSCIRLKFCSLAPLADEVFFHLTTITTRAPCASLVHPLLSKQSPVCLQCFGPPIKYISSCMWEGAGQRSRAHKSRLNEILMALNREALACSWSLASLAE